jgi:hypothetical protein
MCLAILERALRLLSAEKALPESEVDLNRLLYFCLLTASSELYPRDPVAPISECNNQPDPDDISRVAREQKRPDFQWIYRDQYELDLKRSSKQFVVECKRIGKPLRADWVFNQNYVRHGICRFRDPKWAYAKRCQYPRQSRISANLFNEILVPVFSVCEALRQGFLRSDSILPAYR